MTKAIVFGLCMLAATASAQDPERAYFGDRKLEPDDLERKALDALGKNRPTGTTDKPVVTGERSVQFEYGAGLPSIICAPFRVCDIALQPGEQIRGEPILGDHRWKVTPGISGEPGSDGEVWHIYVKPEDVGLQTSLTVTTDRRAYHFQLASDRKKYMARISFRYPESHASQWARFRHYHGRRSRGRGRGPDGRAERSTPWSRPRQGARPSQAGAIDAISHNYELEGDEPAWTPSRVYNDGVHTIIEFPPEVKQTQMPALVAIRYEGGLFTDDEAEAVNYRIHGNRIKVDGVPNIIDLVSGVGSTQTKVRIRRTAAQD